MLRYKFNELLRKKSFEENRDLTVDIIIAEAGISYVTVSKLKNKTEGEHYFSTLILDKLCAWFDCKISDLVEYIPTNKKTKKKAAI